MGAKTMTEAELEIFRLKMKLEVHLVLLRGLYTGLANSSPAAGKALRERFEALRKDHGGIAFQKLREGYSDMLAAEYQEALDDALSSIEDGLKG